MAAGRSETQATEAIRRNKVVAEFCEVPTGELGNVIYLKDVASPQGGLNSENFPAMPVAQRRGRS